VTLSFLLGAVACAFAGLCYAEMSSTVPISGSAYTYAYATMGELVAWIIGWDLILEYAIGAGTVAIGWSAYVVSFARDFGINTPAQFVSAPLAFDAGIHSWSTTTRWRTVISESTGTKSTLFANFNSLPFNATGEVIESGGVWRVYEFTWQMDAILFWARFEGRWLRGTEFHYPERPENLPSLKPLKNWPKFNPRNLR
jgi:amino acid transporter